MSKEMIRIILVDNHKLVRESWKLLLHNNSNLSVIADCDNGQGAIRLVQEIMPDVMLIDINMKPMNGFEVTEQLLKINPSLKIIGLSVHNQPHYASKLIELGAKGYLTKTSPLEEVNHCISQVYNGHYYICEEVRRNMTAEDQRKMKLH